MQKYGKITSKGLLVSNHTLEGYKPIKYGEIPSFFYEETHYLVEKEPVELDDYIQVDYGAKELEIEVDEDSELALKEIEAGIEERKKEYFENKAGEPPVEERLEKAEQLLQAATMAFSEYVFDQMVGK